jgi:hypothetical protein
VYLRAHEYRETSGGRSTQITVDFFRFHLTL